MPRKPAPGRPELTAERLRHLLCYDPETGIFTRRFSRAGIRAGTQCGYPDRQHEDRVQICVDYRKYSASRLAWLYVNGVWPTAEIDHINRDPTDNRIANLRDVSRGENEHNGFKPKGRNTSGGFRGVYLRKGRGYIARIRANGKYVYLGQFETAKEAAIAYLTAKATFHPTVPLAALRLALGEKADG